MTCWLQVQHPTTMPPSHSVFCNYLYFRDRATNFVEIWNIYANQMEIKVAISVINSDKLNRIYDNLYLRITFIDLFALKCVLIDWVSDGTGVRGLWRKAWRSSLHKDQVEQHVEERLRFFSTMALYKFTYFVLKMLLNTKQPTTG